MATCKFCYRKITKAVLAEKRRRKVENALNSTAKRIANGTKAGGRPKVRDDKQICALRKRGLSIRAIAKEIGLSTTAVMRGLKSASPEEEKT